MPTLAADPVAVDLARVEARMLALATRDLEDPELLAAVRHHLSGGGRRRGRLALEICDTLGLRATATSAIACAVELLHAASLVHDDLQDRACSRRGGPSVASRFGDDVALLIGDVLIAAAFGAAAELVSTRRDPAPMSRLHRALARSACGQNRERAGDAGDGASYDDVAVAKSGPLFALPFELALTEAGFSAAVPEARHAAGHFALAYQLRDDIDDVARDEATGELNAVLLQEAAGMSRQSATAAVARRALAELEAASARARRLPRQAGRPLVRLSNELQCTLGDSLR